LWTAKSVTQNSTLPKWYSVPTSIKLSTSHWLTDGVRVGCAEGDGWFHAKPEVGVIVHAWGTELRYCHAVKAAPVLMAATLVGVVHDDSFGAVRFTAASVGVGRRVVMDGGGGSCGDMSGVCGCFLSGYWS